MLIKYTVNKPCEYTVDVSDEQFLETLKKRYCKVCRSLYEHSALDVPDEVILEKVYQQAAKEVYEKNPEVYAN